MPIHTVLLIKQENIALTKNKYFIKNTLQSEALKCLWAMTTFLKKFTTGRNMKTMIIHEVDENLYLARESRG